MCGDPLSVAHPRSRGENILPALEPLGGVGSSPLTRGKPAEWDGGGVRVGLIPAHAGKTHCPAPPCRSHRAHPRSRGENHPRLPHECGGRGSSPLTRGKPLDGLGLQRVLGLIPAHAGKTAWRSCPTCRGRAHPRSRGENLLEGLNRVVGLGSSPLTRGKQRWNAGRIPILRLIPAHAGKTPRGRTLNSATWAHPRSRGENSRSTVMPRSLTGSSPLTRGKHDHGGPARVRPGLIPAHAGKTSCTTG